MYIASRESCISYFEVLPINIYDFLNANMEIMHTSPNHILRYLLQLFFDPAAQGMDTGMQKTCRCIELLS